MINQYQFSFLFLDFGDDLELPNFADVFLQKDQNIEDFYEINEKLGEYVLFGFLLLGCNSAYLFKTK